MALRFVEAGRELIQVLRQVMGADTHLAVQVDPIVIKIVRRVPGAGYVADWLGRRDVLLGDTIFGILVVTVAAPLAELPVLPSPP